MVYLDNSATTRPDSEVIRVVADVMENVYGNPSSLHGWGGKAERLLKQAREVTARLLGVSPGSLVFTSGGTEANNMAIKGVAFQHRNRGRHLITTQVEHAAVLEVCRQLELMGWKVTRLPVDESGRVRPQDVEAAMTEETVLVSVMHTNNEVGTIQPIPEIGRIVSQYPKAFFHVDAVQAFGKCELRPREWGVDLMSLSAHKFHGPKGVGSLYVRKGVTLSPLLTGGGQEEGFRSGTQNVPGIAGFAKAAILAEERRGEAVPRWLRWKGEMIEALTSSVDDLKINGDQSAEGGAPHILSLSFPGLKSEVIVHALEEKGVYVSSKSACSSKGEKPSYVLKAMGLSDEVALGAVRISMGWTTTQEDICQCIKALTEVIPRLKHVMKGVSK